VKSTPLDKLSKAELLELLIEKVKAMQKSIEEKKIDDIEKYNKQITKLEKLIRSQKE
jgi:hypothetical protein